MPYYKDKNNKVHFLDNDEFEHFLPQGCVKISDEEADELNKPSQEELLIIQENEKKYNYKKKKHENGISYLNDIDGTIDNATTIASLKAIVKELANIIKNHLEY